MELGGKNWVPANEPGDEWAEALRRLTEDLDAPVVRRRAPVEKPAGPSGGVDGLAEWTGAWVIGCGVLSLLALDGMDWLYVFGDQRDFVFALLWAASIVAAYLVWREIRALVDRLGRTVVDDSRPIEEPVAEQLRVAERPQPPPPQPALRIAHVPQGGATRPPGRVSREARRDVIVFVEGLYAGGVDATGRILGATPWSARGKLPPVERKAARAALEEIRPPLVRLENNGYTLNKADYPSAESARAALLRVL